MYISRRDVLRFILSPTVNDRSLKLVPRKVIYSGIVYDLLRLQKLLMFYTVWGWTENSVRMFIDSGDNELVKCI